ncbi:hypothetical protein CPB83DRAFT_923362, partial [Crepidotus variabilis]
KSCKVPIWKAELWHLLVNILPITLATLHSLFLNMFDTPHPNLPIYTAGLMDHEIWWPTLSAQAFATTPPGVQHAGTPGFSFLPTFSMAAYPGSTSFPETEYNNGSLSRLDNLYSGYQYHVVPRWQTPLQAVSHEMLPWDLWTQEYPMTTNPYYLPYASMESTQTLTPRVFSHQNTAWSGQVNNADSSSHTFDLNSSFSEQDPHFIPTSSTVPLHKWRTRKYNVDSDADRSLSNNYYHRNYKSVVNRHRCDGCIKRGQELAVHRRYMLAFRQSEDKVREKKVLRLEFTNKVDDSPTLKAKPGLTSIKHLRSLHAS